MEFNLVFAAKILRMTISFSRISSTKNHDKIKNKETETAVVTTTRHKDGSRHEMDTYPTHVDAIIESNTQRMWKYSVTVSRWYLILRFRITQSSWKN